MKPQTFQHPEIRDENDNIIKPGAFGKNSAFFNAENDGIGDYIFNDLEWLYENINSGQGTQGPQGPPGNDGDAATIQVGTVTTSEPGAQAEVINVGTANAAILNFSIPKGERGESENLSLYVTKTELFDGNMIKLPNGAKIGVE